MTLPSCPKCSSAYVYQDGNLLVCPECAYEFSAEELKEHEVVIKDSNSNVLKDGDTVTVIKDLKNLSNQDHPLLPKFLNLTAFLLLD
jgi:protein PhnA